MILLIPVLGAYSNNPHKSAALAKTLYYFSLVSHSFSSCVTTMIVSLHLMQRLLNGRMPFKSKLKIGKMSTFRLLSFKKTQLR